MQTLNMEQVRVAALRDQANRRPGVATAPDSDWFFRATALASATSGLYDYQAHIELQIFPDTADHAALLHHAALRGLTPHPATQAAGGLTLTGTNGTTIPSGTVFKAADGNAWQTTSAAQIANNSASAPAAAQQRGNAGNAAPGTALTIASAIPGIDANAFIDSMEGGYDDETDAHLLQRLLDLLRYPPAGGNKKDYERWALEVPGIDRAAVYPLRRGPGTVDIVVNGKNGPPAPNTLAAVIAHIEAVRPVALKDVRIMAPVIKLVPHTVAIRVASGQPADYQAAINAAITTAMASLQPGQSYIKSATETAISNLPGIIDRSLTQPPGNIDPIANANTIEWLQPGAITVVAL